MLLSALSGSSHFGSSVHYGIRLFGLLKGAAIFRAAFPEGGRPSSYGAVAPLDPKRIRLRAVAIGHFRVVATLPVIFTSSVLVCSIVPLLKLPPCALGADARCREGRRPLP